MAVVEGADVFFSGRVGGLEAILPKVLNHEAVREIPDPVAVGKREGGRELAAETEAFRSVAVRR